MQQTLEILFVLEEKSFLLLLDKQNLTSVFTFALKLSCMLSTERIITKTESTETWATLIE